MGNGSKPLTSTTIGRKYGKIDLDRVGYFDDGVSGPFDKYNNNKNVGYNKKTVVTKSGQILSGPRMEMFEKKFERLFIGEGLSETWREESKKRVLERKKNVGIREFQTGSPGKQHSTPNDFFGCFNSPASLDHAPYNNSNNNDNRKKKFRTPSLPNCKIKPNPIGGPGYANICFSPYPKHDIVDPYETKKSKKEREGRFLTASSPQSYFPPDPYKSTSSGPTYVRPRVNSEYPIIGSGKIYVPGPKKIGGSKAGCFDKFPPYESSPYYGIKINENRTTTEAAGKWIAGYPTHREKYTKSIIDYGTKISCNANNYTEYKEKIYPLRF